MSQPVPNQASPHRRAGREAEALLGGLLALSERARIALDTHDAAGILAAVREREATARRLEPLLQHLLEARANLAGGSRSSMEMAEIGEVLATISRVACRVQEVDRDVAIRLAAERERIENEIEQIERAVSAAAEPLPRYMPRGKHH